MTKHTVRHRHFVAIPAFLVMVGLSFTQTFVDLPDLFTSMQSSVSTEGKQEEFSFDSGIYGVLYDGSLQQGDATMRMDDGTVLIATEGILRLQTAHQIIAAVNGALYVSTDPNGTTVAAIDTPAYIMSGDQRVTVPAGMQWKHSSESIAPLGSDFDSWITERTPSILPESFVSRKLTDLSEVSDPNFVLPKMYGSSPGEDSLLTQLLLPMSAKKAERKKTDKALGVLRFAVEQGSTQALEEVLADPIVQEAMQTPRGQDVLVRLLDGRDTSVRMLLLQQLVQHEDVWALASAHPEYASVTWSIFEPETSVEAQLSRVFTLPYVAQTAEEFPTYIFERHLATMRGMLGKVGEPTVFIEHLLTAHVPVVFTLDALGYPQRARVLRDNLNAVVDDALEKTALMKEAKEELLQLDRIALDPLGPKKIQATVTEQLEVAVPEEPETVYTAEQAEAMAYQLLTDAGALFSVQSAVAAFAPNTVRVSDILFSTATEDRTVSFTLDVARAMVTDIEVNGNDDFPYSPTFEGFVTWIRK